MREPNKMPDWLKRQFDNAEATVATWSDGKCEAAGIPREKPAPEPDQEVIALRARVAFLEAALDQAIELTEMEFVPSRDRDEKAVPDCICWADGYSYDMTHVEQLGVYLEEKW